MAVLQIPTRSDIDSYSFTIDLDGKTYGFSFHFNGRMQIWLFSISTENGLPLVESVPVLVNTDVLGRYTSEDLPPGHILFVDKSGANLDPGLDDLGSRVIMFYIDVAEVI